MKKKDFLEGKDYIIISTKTLYPGFIGVGKWIIVTDLEEEELCSRHLPEIASYRPWILITVEQYAVMVDWKRNEEKYRRRASQREIYYGVDQSFIEKQVEEDEINNLMQFDEYFANDLLQGCKELTASQERRIQKFYLEGHSMRQIAEEEKVSFTSIEKSIKFGIKKLRNYAIGYSC